MSDFTMTRGHGYYDLAANNQPAIDYLRAKWKSYLDLDRTSLLLPSFFADAAYSAMTVCRDGFSILWGEETFPAGEEGANGLYEASA